MICSVEEQPKGTEQTETSTGNCVTRVERGIAFREEKVIKTVEYCQDRSRKMRKLGSPLIWRFGFFVNLSRAVCLQWWGPETGLE